MKIKELKGKLALTVFYGAILCVFWALGVPCVFKNFLKIPCPGCGISRAVWSALRLDFAAAFSFHPMFWSLPILYIYFLFDGSLTGKKKLDRFIFIGIAVGFAVNWIVNLFFK